MQQVLALFLSLFFSYAFAGLPANTLIKNSHGMIPIQQLAVGDEVIGLHEDGTHASHIVTHTRSYRDTTCVYIQLSDELLCVSKDQKFYLPATKAYKSADLLIIGDGLLTYAGDVQTIKSIMICEQEIEFFDITVDTCHNFFISKHEILVHNMPPVFIGFTWAFGGGALEFAGASISAAVLGTVAALKWTKSSSDGNSNNRYKNGSCSFAFGAPPDDNNDNDDEFKKQHPHGKYVGSAKHHKNSYGPISKAPKNGQKALDQSISISQKSPKRMGVSNGEIVELRMTRSGEYHGYVVEWEHLDDYMQGLLKKNGLTNHKGKTLL